jgi:drug/metabolite transporter (DMT)-like permease
MSAPLPASEGPDDVAGSGVRAEPPPQRALDPQVGVALGAIAISFAPVFVEGMDRSDVGPTGIALYRTLIGGVLLTALALLRRERLRPSRGALGFAALGAVGQGAGWVTLSTFVPRVAASRAALLLLLQPAFAVGWAALFFGRTMTATQGIGCAVTLAAIDVGAVVSTVPVPSDPGGTRYAPRPDAAPD